MPLRGWQGDERDRARRHLTSRRPGIRGATPAVSHPRQSRYLGVHASPVGGLTVRGRAEPHHRTHPARDAWSPDRKGPEVYGISSDDRLWLIERDHSERRSDAANQRMASAASRERRAQSPAARDAGHASIRHPRTTAAHLLRAFTGTLGSARHGAAR